MKKREAFRGVALALSGILFIIALTSCGKKEESEISKTEATVATTEVTTTLPTTTQPTATQPTVPLYSSPYKEAPVELRSEGVEYFLPASPPAPVNFFDDAVFVGDSVGNMLKYYAMGNGCMGDIVFLTSISLGCDNALWDLNNPNEVHPTYQGEKIRVPEGIKKSDRKKVYIMLGLNDLSRLPEEKAFDNFKVFTDEVLKTTPDVKLYIQSVTPVYRDRGIMTNEKINRYNAQVSKYCMEKQWEFIDVASVMRTEENTLKGEYCCDKNGLAMHPTNEALQAWVDYLYTHSGIF